MDNTQQIYFKKENEEERRWFAVDCSRVADNKKLAVGGRRRSCCQRRGNNGVVRPFLVRTFLITFDMHKSQP